MCRPGPRPPQGRTDEAFRLLEGVLRDARSDDARALHLPDPFHEACALYELAVLQINRGGFHEAERLLRDLGTARGGFAFETVLQYRFKAARDYVQQQLKGGGGAGKQGGGGGAAGQGEQQRGNKQAGGKVVEAADGVGSHGGVAPLEAPGS